MVVSLVKRCNAVMVLSGGLPAGEPQAGHLRRCACLKGGLPFLRKRALHLTGRRLAEWASKSDAVH